MTTKQISLDAWRDSNVSVTAIQGEVNARFLQITLWQQGQPLNLTGKTAAIYCKKPDGTIVFNSCVIDNAKDGIISVGMTSQMSAVDGKMKDVEIRLTEAGGSTLKVKGLSITILPSNYDGAVESTDEFTALQNALGQVGDIEDIRDTASSAIPSAEKGTANGVATLDAAGRLEQYSGVPNYPPMPYTGSMIEEAAVSSPLYDLKIYGKTTETVTGTKSPDNPSTLTGVGERGELDVWVHGKNFTDVTGVFPWSTNGITISYDAGTQIFTINGTNTGSTAISVTKRRMRWEEGDNYTIGAVYIGGTITKTGALHPTLQLEGRDTNYGRLPTTVITAANLTEESASTTIIASEYAGKNVESMCIFFYLPQAGMTFTNYKIKIQVERSSTATAWEPYRGNFYTVPLPSPLYSLPDGTCDTLEKKEGKWGVTRRVGQALCDGAHLKCGFATSVSDDVFSFSILPPNAAFASTYNAYSDRFAFAAGYVDGLAIVNPTGSFEFRVNKTRTNNTVSMAAADAWLQSNNIFGLYSRTEAFEVLPDATQAILNGMVTMEGSNIIHNSDGAEMDVTLAGVAVSMSQMLNYVYPVGSVYISTSSTSPATIIGGTWERIQDRFLLAAGTSYTAGTTGGEAEHTLTVAEIPSHTHNDHTNLDARVVAGNDYCGVTTGMQGETAATGGGLAHNNMPPYLAVYMWTRTA